MQEAFWQRLPDFVKQRILWPRSPPKDDWHSFDRHPWMHPWLTAPNIRNFRAFSDGWLSKLVESFDARGGAPKKYAFVGNMANNLYMRSRALSHRNLSIETYLHPHDQFLMSHPSWEEYDGEVPDGVASMEAALSAGLHLPDVPGIYRCATVPWTDVETRNLVGSMRFLDRKRFPDYFTYMPTLLALQKYDALLGVQVPYLAYLTGKPYAVTQMGGDIWYDCSRDDMYGRLQRRAFSKAGAFIVSNPWSLAFGRRYGIRNMVYLPFLLDEARYSPGPAEFRAQWAAETGGDFFVLMSSRLDYLFKGSHLAVNAFARFAAQTPGARLVIAGWGADKSRVEALFAKLGIENKVLVVSIAGKKRLIKYLRSADCLIDQLTLGYYGASALEGMACGVPVIMNLNHEQYDALIPEGCAPVCHAQTEEAVFLHLTKLHDDPTYRAKVGENLRGWFLETHSNEKWGKLYEAVLWATSEHKLPTFCATPLGTALEKVEENYHSLELLAAPEFPNYV